jgi:hypothetical protein
MSFSEEVCRRCGHEFCSECVLYPFGISKGAMCISCALEAGGISRQKTGRPKFNQKVIKQRVSDHHDRSPRPPATEPESQHDHEDDLDQAWLNGDIDAETLGGWSRTY